MTDCFRKFDIEWARIRPRTSVDPPGAYGITIVIGFSGKSWACTGAAIPVIQDAANRALAAIFDIFLIFAPWFFF
jgi:hypothetical protein